MEYIRAIIIVLVVWLAIRELRLMVNDILHYMFLLRKKR